MAFLPYLWAGYNILRAMPDSRATALTVTFRPYRRPDPTAVPTMALYDSHRLNYSPSF